MMGPFPTHDMHVHSTFSDGQATIGENVVRAIALGLDELTLVDHVRVGTDWVPAPVHRGGSQDSERRRIA
jgi:histidinol phosphatase-like PHP family hydrolase